LGKRTSCAVLCHLKRRKERRIREKTIGKIARRFKSMLTCSKGGYSGRGAKMETRPFFV